MPTEPMHSTGRGGTGNIGRDSAVIYTDGGIVREGVAGETADGEFSTGRGGAGNIDATEAHQPGQRRTDEDVVPEPSLREDHQSNFHTGRGGQGNVHKDKYGGHSTADEQDNEGRSIGDKIKHVLGMDKDKK